MTVVPTTPDGFRNPKVPEYAPACVPMSRVQPGVVVPIPILPSPVILIISVVPA